MFTSRDGKYWYNPTALNKSKGTLIIILNLKFNIYNKFIRSMAVLVSFCSFDVCFRSALFFCRFIMIMRWIWWSNFDLHLRQNTWWKHTRGDFPATGRTKTQTAEIRVHCAGATLSSSYLWILGGFRKENKCFRLLYEDILLAIANLYAVHKHQRSSRRVMAEGFKLTASASKTDGNNGRCTVRQIERWLL